MSDLVRLAKRPAASIHPNATVQEACETLIRANVGALVVLDEGRLVGIFSERDVVTRVVASKREPPKTLVSEVMTRDVCTANATMTVEEVTELMHARRIRHVPVVDASGRVQGILSMRHLLQRQVEQLAESSRNIVDYLGADGPGG